jgi:hypothetical protein
MSWPTLGSGTATRCPLSWSPSNGVLLGDGPPDLPGSTLDLSRPGDKSPGNERSGMSEGHRTVAAAATLIFARTYAEREAAALGMVDALVEADAEEYTAAFEALCQTFSNMRLLEPLLLGMRAARLARGAQAKTSLDRSARPC